MTTPRSISFLLTPVLLASFMAATVGCKGKTNKNYGDTADGLTEMMNDMVEASDGDAKSIAKRFRPADPVAFYKSYFDDELAEKLAAEVAPHHERIETLAAAIKGNKSKGKTELKVEKFTDAGSDLVTGHQRNALKAMTTQTALYSVRMTEPGKDSGFHLWSFIHVDGGFVYAGKMKAAGGPSTSKDLEMLGELRIRSAKEILSGKK